jgi:Toluene-4-monooxygenase system protein B (TmoB)
MIDRTEGQQRGKPMSAFPLVCNYEGDYGMKLLMVDSEDTMDDVARRAKEALVGVVVRAPRRNAILRVRRHRAREPLPRTLKVGNGQFVLMETVDIYQSDA